MPTLAYSVLILVFHFTSGDKEYKAWVNFLIVLIIPFTGYLFTKIVLPLWDYNTGFETHAFLVLIIAATLLFLFFLVRGVLIAIVRKTDVWKKYYLILKIPAAIVLPLLGLLVNNGFVFDKFNFSEAETSGIFGNFNSIWFYILAVVNGIFICLPDQDKKIYRLVLFAGRSITLSFTFYFFLVFLPFLPFSVIAIIAAGTGFLMLTPLALFVIHINEVHKDIQYLKEYFSLKIIRILLILCAMTIPAAVTLTYIKDKAVLNTALEYLYAPDYSRQYKINNNSLQKTIPMVKNHKNRNNVLFFNEQIPYLTSYFNRIVFNNLTLSDVKINHAENVFSVKLRRKQSRKEFKMPMWK